MKIPFLKVAAAMIGIAVMMLGSAKVEASTVTDWIFENVTMSDGSSLVGTFATDSSLQIVTYDIHVQGGPQNGYFFSNTIANFVALNGPQTYEISNFGNGFIEWSLVAPLTAATTKADISGSEFFCQACNNYLVTGTSGDIAATPLPAALPIFASGLGALGLLSWRRKKKGAAIPA